jgi:PAS domain S-box-containing protein
MQKPGQIKENRLPEQFDLSFKVLAEMSPTGIHISDSVGKCLYVNPAWCRMAGLKCEEATGDGWIKAIHPEDRNRLFSEWESFMKEETQWESEYRFVDVDGEITWVYGTGTLLKGSNGLVQSIIGMTINITERKKYENELKESEERLRLASQATGFGTYSYEFENGNAYYSKEFFDLYGLSPGETLELDHDLVPKAIYPDDKKSFLTAMQKANDPHGSGILDIEFRIVRKDGSERWLRTRGLTTFSGNKITDRPLRATGIVQDITELNKSERDLYEFGERYRLLMENSGLGIGYYGLDGKILMFNQQAIVNLGGKPQDYIGKNVTEIFGKEAGQIYIDRFKLASVSEKPLKFEDKVNLKGKPGWYMSTHTRILDQNGDVDGVQVIADNITEKKIIEEKIITSEAEYRSLFENSIMGISQTYPGGDYKRINKAYAEMYGYPDTSTMMKELSFNVKMLYSNPEDRKRVLQTLDKNGFLAPIEIELNRRNGEKFWALVSAKQVRDNTGKLLYMQAEHIDITSQKKMEAELRKSHELLEKLNQHLVNSIEEERNQIALNLHDDLGQKLTAINLDIAWLKSRIGVQSKTVREKFEEMSSMVKETIESTKKTSAFLRPAILFDLGLVPAIKSLLVNFEKQTAIKCNFYYRPEEFVLEDMISLILYRIFQESMTNIARHSGASKADINLYVLKNKIELIIKDDGSGIEKNKVNSFKSLGIAGIKERVKSVNGRMNIVGVPGSGTMITVEIPFLKVKTND